ncbi:hypothetical protein G5B97_05390 [Campylobacter concisus]|uniref:hypothetical protein n=1 Tax=Campylobacter concisus TaxID=199 RepID=UPI0018AA98E4|nr:hypothetical protein [Campylobacter concisus]QPH99549.1 hypothetical protein G5B98_05175 [Campylobacter concisus]QPI01345.1 hypothetical protein G5B97_05390 [Campylobacter concisus]
MSYELKEIILERTANLEPALQKQAKKLNQKIINTNFYHDAKNLEKIGAVISPELNEFLLSCALEYDKTHADKFDTFDNDVETLRGVWSAMSFSKSPEILDYLNIQAARSVSHRSFAHRYIFEILRLQEKAGRTHPLLAKLYDYYNGLQAKLPIYELLRRIGVSPADPYDFDISLNAVNFGYWFSNQGLSDDELAGKFHLEIRFFAPFINDHTFEIELRNDAVPRARINFNDDGMSFLQELPSNALLRPDILNLKPFIAQMKSYFHINFDVDNKDMTNISASKGLNKGKVTSWLKEIFS